MTEPKGAKSYEEIRSKILRVIQVIGIIMFCLSLLKSRFDFDGFSQTVFYKHLASVFILILGSTPWIIFIRFKDDTSWILRELRLEGGNRDDSKNSDKPRISIFGYSFIMTMMFLNHYGNALPFIPRIIVPLVFSSVHYLSFTLSIMLGMYRYISAKTDIDSQDDKIINALDEINKGYQTYYAAFLVISTIFCIFYLLFAFVLSDDFEYITGMFRFLLVLVSVGSFCFFISRFSVNCMIFHLNGSGDKTPSQKNQLLEMASSQAKFTKNVIVFPILPLLYGTAFFVIFKSLSALPSPALP